MAKECGHERHHSEEKKQDMLNRLKRIEGQVRGISKMIENNVYCDDILNQFASVESALSGVKKILLESHLKSCILSSSDPEEQEQVDEVIQTIKKLM